MDTIEYAGIILHRTPTGVRYDGAGQDPLQTYYTNDADAVASAIAADPGHARPVYEYRAEGCGNWCRTPEEAVRLARRPSPRRTRDTL